MIWELKKAYYRIIQTSIKVGTKLAHFREPQLISGSGSLSKLPEIIKDCNVKKVLIIVSKTLMRSGILYDFIEKLEECSIYFEIYDSVKPNPSIDNIEDCLRVYKACNCDAIVAIGGGSPIDCAKMVGARASNDSKRIKDFKGFFKIPNPLPPFFAVPTTAGSGSETTIAAVITDSDTHEKYAVADIKLLPIYAVLDPELTLNVPQNITSWTGMDALTHAIEAYIGNGGNSYTDKNALNAAKLIVDNLEKVYKDGHDIEGRNDLLLAANYAGRAFTIANVGYVHALSHSLGGLYGIAHGLANAVLLPRVLEYYGNSAYKKLSQMALHLNLGTPGETTEALALKLISKIEDMNKNMNIPSGISELKKEDIPLIAERTIKEANPAYPVPKIISVTECQEFLENLSNF